MKIKIKRLPKTSRGRKTSKSMERISGDVFTKPQTRHCVHCGRPMIYGTNWDKFVPVCFEPDCPNYGLLQIGREGMCVKPQ